MRTYLFGAGASHSYAISPTGVQPPLAKGLFDAFHQLDIAEDSHVRIGDIVCYVRDTRNVDATVFGAWNEDIETFLSEVEDLISRPEDVRSLDIGQKHRFSRVYDQSVFLFCSVLNEIQNGPVCRNYSKLVSQLGAGDVLITFNWDTLLDRALSESGRWCPQDGYEMSFKGFYDNGWCQPASVASESDCRLLKLHGSTNWLMPYRTLNFETCERSFANRSVTLTDAPIYCFVRSEDCYPTYHSRSRAGYQPFSYFNDPPDLPFQDNHPKDEYGVIAITTAYDLPEHGTVHKAGLPRASMPMIIAPVRHKEYDLCGNALGNLWTLSSRAIAECSELVIIGYSFPETDVRAWDLFEGAVAARGSKLKVQLVDPYPDGLLMRMQDRLGECCTIDVHQCTFEEFIVAERLD